MMSSKRPGTDDRLSLNVIHKLLAARYRRYTLYCLYLHANPMRLPDVAEQIAEWEHSVSGEKLLDERLRTYNELYATHIPKLVDAEVVSYSQSEDMIELAGNASQLRPYLERAVEADLNANDITPN